MVSTIFSFSVGCLFLSCVIFFAVPTLCDPIDGSPQGSPVPGILQARTLEWVTISFSNAGKWKWSHSVVSNSVQPHRWQSTRLPHPWDSPGKNTGVGCHFLLQCMKVKGESEVAQWSLTVSDPMDCSPPGSSVHGIFQASVLEWGATAFSEVFSPFLLVAFSFLCDFLFCTQACKFD